MTPHRLIVACMVVAGLQPPWSFPAPTPPVAPPALVAINRPLYTKIGNVSSYCDHGITASGRYTAPGSAGGDYWLPLGSLVDVATHGVVLIDDRGRPGIADVDIWSPSCSWSILWGRRFVRISVLRFGWGTR